MRKAAKKKKPVTKKRAPVKNTGGGGFTFENSVAARFLLDMLGQTHALGADKFGRVTRLDWQAKDSGWLADDLVITSRLGESDRAAAISAKSGQSVTVKGFPSEFVRTVWSQWFQEGSQRIFRATGDVMVLATGAGTAAAQTPWATLLRESLATSPDRMLKRLTDDQACGQQTSKEERAIFASLACPKQFAAQTATGEETISLLRQVRWLDFDFEKQQSHAHDAAIADCRMVLIPQEVHRAEELWSRLVGIADVKRPLGGTLDLRGLIEELKGRFNFRGIPKYDGDWAELARRSAAEMDEIKTEIVGLPRLVRKNELEAIRAELSERSACFLIGESGCGKSALVKEFVAANYKRAIWFSADSLEYASQADFEKGIGLRHGVAEIIDSTLDSTAIIFDGIEGFSKKAKKVAAQIIRAARASGPMARTHIILTAQAEGASPLLMDLLSLGLPEEVLRPTPVGRPNVADVRSMVRTQPQVGWVALSSELKSLLTNLKTLDWFIQFAKSGGTLTSGNVGLTNLIDSLWTHWVETGDDRFVRSTLLVKIATIQADTNVNAVAPSSLDHAEQATLGKIAGGELLRVHGNLIRFSHDLLSDWARLQALIGETWLVTEKSRERYISPKWHKAMRLYGQRLLEQSRDGGESWRESLEAVDDGTSNGRLVRDLFLDALLVTPNSRVLLEQAWPLLTANRGKLLNVLIDRFLYVGTLPDPRLSTLLDDPSDAAKYEHAMRVPYWPYWGPLITVLHAHRAEVGDLASNNAAKVCAQWLSFTNLLGGAKLPWQKECAELALAIAREVQCQNLQGPHWSAGADKVVYEALLHAASELPQEVGQLCLELANRRDANPEVVKRAAVARAKRRAKMKKDHAPAPQRKPLPRPIPFLGRRRKPWPDGPRERIDRHFETACLQTSLAVADFAKANPDAALEVLLAVCIEEPKHEQYGRSYLEDLGLTYWHEGDPPMWYRGPFLSFLNAAQEHGLTLIIKLVNFATKRYQQSGAGITFKIGGKKRLWVGDSNVFTWHFDGHVMHGAIVRCALMALEKWLFSQIEANKDVTAALDRIMSESESIAFAGVVLTIAKKEPSLLIGPLRPLMDAWLLWIWDFELTHQRVTGIRSYYGYWGNQTAHERKIAEAWITLPHRRIPFRDILLTQYLPLAEHKAYFTKLRKAWERQLDENREPPELRRLVELIRRENHTFEIVDGKPVWKDFTWPEAEQAIFDERAQKANEQLLLMRLPMECRRILDTGQRYPSEQLEAFIELLKTTSEKPVATHAGGDEPMRPAADGVFGGIAVLIVLHYDWLSADASRLEWCRAQLKKLLMHPPPQSRFYLDSTTNAGDTWDGFAAESGIAMLARNRSDRLARKLVARGITSFFYSTTLAVVSKATALKADLKDDFGRVIAAALHWSAIRPALDNLPFVSDVAHWRKRKADLLKNFQDCSLSASLPNIKALNTKARKVLDDIEAKQYPGYAARLAKKRATRSESNREDLHPEPLGLDANILTSALSWLNVRPTDTPAERANVIGWLGRLLELVRSTIPIVEDEKAQEVRGLPSNFDQWVLGRIATAIPVLSPMEKPERLWQPILDLGPHAHDWIERFYWDWFIHGSVTSPDLSGFFRQWRAMIEHALNSPLWEAPYRYYDLETMVIELLGFDGRWSAWKLIEGVGPRVCAMADLYEKAATKWFHRPKVLRGFVAFAASQPAFSGLALKSIPWIATAIKSYDDYDWRHGAEDAVVDYLGMCWRYHAEKITADAALRSEFFSALAVLSARGSHAAIALRDRVANHTNR